MVNNLAYLAQLQDSRSSPDDAVNALTEAPGDASFAVLQQHVERLNANQKLWLSGYLAGSACSLMTPSVPTELASSFQAGSEKQSPESADKVSVIYASQTGNGEAMASALAARLDEQYPVELKSIADVRVSQLKQQKLVIFIVSTHGEGDPPDDALGFFDELAGSRLKGIDSLTYAIISLGDSSYQHYCKTGRDLDARLESLGASRWRKTVELDIDYLDHVAGLESAISDQFATEFNADELAKSSPDKSAQIVPIGSPEIRYDQHHPYQSEVLQVQKITGRDSDKDVRHLELAIDENTLGWQPGDSLGVVVNNDPGLVADLLNGTGINPQDEVVLDSQSMTIEQALRERLELTLLNPRVLARYAEVARDDRLDELVQSERTEQQAWFEANQVIDLVEQFPGVFSAQSLADTLMPLMPRVYSIASSALYSPDEIHLTVALKQSGDERRRFGVASQFLTHRVEAGDSIQIYVQENRHFRLPDDSAADVLMIGPGTGIAPFRAFLQHRQALSEQGVRTGKNWLLFGNPHFQSDFLYQTELLKAHETGLLDRFDVAFSRDQKEKRYVQHLLSENASDVASWIARGGHIYICGARRMSEDVLSSLETILKDHAVDQSASPQQILRDMKIRKQLQLDVY